MSEELLKWKLDASNVTVVRVGQRMLPFQRSLRVRTTENIEVCLHKYCQSKTQKMPGKGLQLCTSKYIQKELRRKESELWKTCAANEVRWLATQLSGPLRIRRSRVADSRAE